MLSLREQIGRLRAERDAVQAVTAAAPPPDLPASPVPAPAAPAISPDAVSR